jgi:ABC-type transporter Mla maintaining outer membrane lipid asymmetry ATPase subunit MlaF
MSTRLEPMPALLDRWRERAVLDGLLGDLRSGRGRALVVRGAAGVGKSALLEYVTRVPARVFAGSRPASWGGTGRDIGTVV